MFHSAELNRTHSRLLDRRFWREPRVHGSWHWVTYILLLLFCHLFLVQSADDGEYFFAVSLSLESSRGG